LYTSVQLRLFISDCAVHLFNEKTQLSIVNTVVYNSRFANDIVFREIINIVEH